MPAAGGPTTQSGVGYQDSIAALYMGRLCDSRERAARDRVREVRIEAPGPVDDIEVLFADGSRRWIQAKERIAWGSEPWRDTWAAFDSKRSEETFRESDRLALWLGTAVAKQDFLREAARRAERALNAQEWWADLSQEQRDVVTELQTYLKSARRTQSGIYDLLRFCEVEVVSAESLRRDWLPLWMPRCRSTSAESLFEILKAKAIEGARYRRRFQSMELIRELRGQAVEICDVSAGLDSYCTAIKRNTASMRIPGTALAGPTADVFLWPRLRSWSQNHRKLPFDHDFYEEMGEAVDPGTILERAGAQVVIIGGAGMGKSALLQAYAHQYCESTVIPAVIPLADLARSGQGVLKYLTEILSSKYAVAIDWAELCEQGRAMILFDGLDELPVEVRSSVLEAISQFSSRFPRSPWAMTVRDMAGTVAPAAALVLEIQPLSLETVKEFCARWLPNEKRPLASEIAETISLSRELRRMARVPLLLALIVEHASTQETAIPTRRSELLEGYLRTLLRPAKHKPAVISIDPLTLRDSAEQIAFATMETGRVDLSIRDAAAAIPMSAQGVLDSLVACGLLQEQGERYRFVFPLIQEYLAGCFVAKQRQNEVVTRFGRQLSRPWAQTLQFAIERMDDADRVVNELLKLQDDAFKTRLKTIGRCVANGARVAPGTKARIGDAIAEQWISEGRRGGETGTLIADGFVRPLPEAAKAHVAQAKQLEFGGGTLLIAEGDEGLTVQALQAALEPGIPGHFDIWQAAIDRIAPIAADMYLERAEKPRTPGLEREVQWIAYLLSKLPAVTEQSDLRVAAASNEKRHPAIRLAAMLALGSVLPSAAETLVEDLLRRLWAHETPGRSPGFDLLCDALFKLPEPNRIWRRMLKELEKAKLFAAPGDWWLRGVPPREAYWRTLVFAIAPRIESESAKTQLRDLASNEELSGSCLDFVDLTCAFLGEESAFAAVSARLETLRQQDIVSWLMLMGRFPPSLVIDGLKRLGGLQSSIRWATYLMLGFTLRYEVEIQDISGGGRGRARRLHPAAGVGASLLRSWANEAQKDSPERFGFLSQALFLGDRDVAPTLLKELNESLSRPRQNSELDYAMSQALDALAESRVLCPPEMLNRAANFGTGNIRFRACAHLESLGTLEALDQLLAIHNQTPPDIREYIEMHIERLALSLGVQINRVANGNLAHSRV